jgi:very-short-patch-repair endonuclease
MRNTTIEAVYFLADAAQDQEIVTAQPRILHGIYPWLRFGEFFTRADWVESFGINLDLINFNAATSYLGGESAFFAAFIGESAPAIGQDRAIALAQTRLETVRRNFNHAASRLCGSPIEQLMLAGLMWATYGYEKKLVEIWDSSSGSGRPQAAVVIAPQYHTERHRADFAVFVDIVANEEIKVVVECDGHDFHEKTKEQAARDKRQYNEAQIAGWRALRFTGSMIWRDHKWCAERVAELVFKELEARLRRRGFLDR